MGKGVKKVRKPSGGIQSLDGALEVLLVMSRMNGPVALSELAKVCGMSASKIHRYLTSFLHAGLVCQTARSGKYDLGPGAVEIGLAALGRHDFVNRTSDDLAALGEATGLTVLFSVWGNSGPTIIRWERAASLVVASLGLGTTLPLLTSATGRIFLAYLPEKITGDIVRREIRSLKASRQLVEDMDINLKGARTLAQMVGRQGYATVDGRYIPGLVALSAPIIDWQDQVQAVVTLIGTQVNAVIPGSREIEQLIDFCKAHSLPKRA